MITQDTRRDSPAEQPEEGSVFTLSAETLRRYSGGQLEIQKMREGYVYRGEIESATVIGTGDEATISVAFTWCAKLEDGTWIADDNLTYKASLLIYSVSDIGDDRIFITAPITGEAATFFPPGGSTLGREKVQGLTE